MKRFFLSLLSSGGSSKSPKNQRCVRTSAVKKKVLCKSASSELDSPHQLAVDKNYHTACPKVLYRADQDRQVFPKMYLDQVDHKHIYLAFQTQVSASMGLVTCRCLVSKWPCVFSDKARPRVQLQLLHDRARLLVRAGSVLCVVRL